MGKNAKAKTVILELKDKVFTLEALRDKMFFYEQEFKNNLKQIGSNVVISYNDPFNLLAVSYALRKYNVSARLIKKDAYSNQFEMGEADSLITLNNSISVTRLRKDSYNHPNNEAGIIVHTCLKGEPFCRIPYTAMEKACELLQRYIPSAHKWYISDTVSDEDFLMVSNFVLDHNISVSLQSYERIHDLNSNKEPCIFTNIDINYLPEKSQMIESTPIIICGRPVKTTVMRSIKKIYNDISALYRLNPYSSEYVIAEAGANGELVTKIPSSFTLIDNAAIQTENEIPSELFSEYDTEYNKYRVSVSVNNHDYFSTGEFYKFIDNKSIEYVGSICPVLLWKGCYIRLEEFEKVLSESPLVNKACFEFMPDNEKKVRLVAYFIPTDSDTTSDLIMEYLSDSLPPLLYPCQVVKLSEFPYDIQNRLYREMLPNPFRSKIVSSDMRMQILDLINEYGLTVDIDTITQENLNKPFSEVGINSLILIEIIVYLEEKLGLRLSDEILNFTLYETVQDFIERICSEAEYHG